MSVILEWYLLRIMVFLVRRRVAESFEKNKKTDERKILKNEQKEKRRMQGKSKSNNSNKYHYLPYKKYILLGNIV